MPAAGIIGTGAYLPPGRQTIDDFVRMGAERELVQKWGILEHRIAGAETATDMEAKAALMALRNAGVAVDEVELIIGATAHPEKSNPANVALTQQKIGALNAGVFTVDLSCAGAIPAMAIANSFIKTGAYKTILLVASCRLQHILDFSDPSTYVVMGDGASAVVVSAVKDGLGFGAFDLQGNGDFWHKSGVERRTPRNPDKVVDKSVREFFYIDLDDGPENTRFHRYLIRSVPESVNRLLARESMTMNDIQWVVPHQNVKGLSGVWLKQLGVPEEKAVLTNFKYGNMSVANIWVNLHEGVEDGRIREGDTLLFFGQGTGFAVGSMLMRWGS